jgi:type 2 lantibiotic biosynthesis protein LanM
MRTLLLPEARGLADDPEDWVDFSALGNSGGQLTPVPVAKWVRAATDRMRLAYKRAEIPTGHSLPKRAGQPVRADAYAEFVLRGFGETYELVRKWRTDFLAPQGPLSTFAGRAARWVPRDTEVYGAALLASFHPRYQRDAITCEAMLRDAMRAATAPESSQLRVLEDAEAADLLACDIPYFHSIVGTADVRGSRGRIPVRVAGDALRSCRTHVEAMSEADLERQAWLVRTAMCDPSKGAPRAGKSRTRSVTEPRSATLIATAARIGDRICDLAITVGDRCTWLVPEVVNSRRLSATVAGTDLYGGLPGIALFLGCLGKVTGGEGYTGTALAAMREALALQRRPATALGKPGAFEGAGGLGYALAHLSAVTGRADLAAEASAIIARSASRAARATDLDIIAGVAGLVAAGIVVARFNRESELIEALRPTVDRLLRLTSAPPRRGATAAFSDRDAGVAHGRAGAGLAFLRWAEATGETEFRAAGAALIGRDFEIKEALRRAEPAKGNGKDGMEHDHALGWCRGSLGIAIAALGADPPLLDLFDRRWATNLAEEIAARGTGGPLCLCHGALGWLEFLDLARRRRCDDRSGRVGMWRRQLLADIADGQWCRDTTHDLESPTLMLGLAGTGHALLRAAAGARVPSVLLLEGPGR